MRWLSLPLDALLEARGILFPWVPVCIALGIGGWFGLAWEPGARHYGALVAALGVAVVLRLRGPERLHPPAVMLACVMLGALAAGVRAHSLEAPILGFRYYGAIEGRIVTIDRSQSDLIRLTLDRVVLERTPPARTPARVRVTMHGAQGFIVPEPGMTVILTGHLSAPEGPVEPGGFDFRRMAFFSQLGAVGYTRTPVLELAPPAHGALWVNRLRARIKAAVMAQVPGEPGAFAAALVTGDRSGIGQRTLEDLRASNLAHLLAISGLHMGLLSGFVFAALRYGLALVPLLALRLNTKKIAAGLALAAGGFYLALSGGNVATERAFVMVAVMLGAVLLDRRALTLRSVAIAACIILILQPESLMGPGFQMSFAATTALVAGFGALRGRFGADQMPRWVLPLFTLFISSALAGLATAPLGAAHFNRIPEYGLIANLLSVPLMGTLVMPAAVVAALLAPFGLSAPALWVMEQGTRWILFVAQWVAGLEGAVIAVPSPGPWVLPVMALGALWLILWRGRLRYAGMLAMAASLVLWVQVDRPPMLVSADAGLIGLAGPSGRAISAPRGNGFAARSWLENDGDLADQAAAAAREGFSGTKSVRSFTFAGREAMHLTGKGALAALPEACAAARLVILAAELVDARPEGCAVIDRGMLVQTGPVAIWPEGPGHLRLEPTRRSWRLWSGAGSGAKPVSEPVAELVLAVR